jgi:hypothetical protein
LNLNKMVLPYFNACTNLRFTVSYTNNFLAILFREKSVLSRFGIHLSVFPNKLYRYTLNQR